MAFHELVVSSLHCCVILTCESSLEFVNIALDLVLDVLGELVFVLLDELLDGVSKLLSTVAGLCRLATCLVFCCVLFSFTNHALDVFLGKRRATGDRHRLLLTGALVLSGHVHDTVGVDVEGDLNLRNTARCWCDTAELEVTQ